MKSEFELMMWMCLIEHEFKLQANADSMGYQHHIQVPGQAGGGSFPKINDL